MSDRHDLVILGGGSAGLVAAFIAAGMRARVALVERSRTGGDCLWTGCVPSKSLIAAAQLAHRIRHADSVGLTPVDPVVDFERVMDRVHGAMATIEPHDSPRRLREAGVEVIIGEGCFVGPSSIQVDGRTLDFRSAIVATGSRPGAMSIDGISDIDVLSTDTVWGLRELPRRLTVLGGGPVGCELAQAFARLGSRVTLVELADRLLAKEEPDASALIAERLGAEGVDVRLDTRAVQARPSVGAATELVMESRGARSAVAFDRLLVATGRRPVTGGIGLEEAGVDVDRQGAVVTDERLRTSARRIYAAGDVTARLPFTHVAGHHAQVAAPNALLGARRTIDETIPWVTFTDPEVAHVGLTEAQARERWGTRTIIARSDYAHLDRAIIDGAPRGFALLVGDPRGRLVGATVAAAGGGEVIAELTALIRQGEPLAGVASTVHAYPTLAQGPARAAGEHLQRRYAGWGYQALARGVLMARRLR